MSEGSDYQDHAMPNQPPGMTLRTRTNVKTTAKPGIFTRDSTFEATYTPDIKEIQHLLRNIKASWDHESVMAVVQQRFRDANSFLAREAFRATNLREDRELDGQGLPRRWEDDGLTPRTGSIARVYVSE